MYRIGEGIEDSRVLNKGNALAVLDLDGLD